MLVLTVLAAAASVIISSLATYSLVVDQLTRGINTSEVSTIVNTDAPRMNDNRLIISTTDVTAVDSPELTQRLVRVAEPASRFPLSAVVSKLILGPRDILMAAIPIEP